MNVYNRVLSELNNQNKLIEELKQKINEFDKNNNITEDRGKNNIENDNLFEQNLVQFNEKLDKTINRIDDMEQKINKINQKVEELNVTIKKINPEVETSKTQIADLVAIIESIITISKK